MRTWLAGCLLLLCACRSSRSTPPETSAEPPQKEDVVTAPNVKVDSLAEYAWSRRPLLVFAENEKELAAQRVHVERARAGIGERDMVVLEITDRLVIDGVDKGVGAARTLRAKYEPAGPLTLVLVGKDGGEKRRYEGATSLESIFAIIDTMPMRQEEMRKAGGEP